MNDRLSLAVIVGTSLTLTAPVVADFTGIGGTIRRVTTVGSEIDLDVVEIYATFDSSADQALAVAGSGTDPQILNSGGSVGFFQVTIFGTWSNGPLSICTITNMEYDSLLSIGLRQCHGGAQIAPTIDGFNVIDFNGGSSIVTTVNGGWSMDAADPETFAVPFPPAGTFQSLVTPPGATHGVILGQFSVRAGDTFSGNLGQLTIREAAIERLVTDADPAGLNTFFSFLLQLMPPLPFALTSPAPGTYVTTAMPTLEWETSSLAETYTVTIDDNANLSSPLLVQTGITDTSFDVPAGLLTNGIVYWQVTAENSDGSVIGGPDPADFALVGACRQDLSGNGLVDFADILEVIAAWGVCQ